MFDSNRLRGAVERWFTLSVIVTAAIVLAALAALAFQPDYSRTLQRSGMSPELGHAFIVKLPQPPWLYELRSHGDSKASGSALVLSESGRVLGPANSLHSSIRQTGRGAFSHWFGYLYFSTSDNTDPRQNGRSYGVQAPLYLSGIFKLLLAASLAISFGASWLLWRADSRHPLVRFARRTAESGPARRAATAIARARALVARNRTVLAPMAYWGVLLVAAAWVNVLFLQGTQYRPCLSPDSGGYLNFNLTRPPLYPAIVQLAYHLTGDIRWVIPLQLNALLASLAVLGAVVGRLSGCRLCGLTFTLLGFCTLPVLLLSYMVLSEALFTVFIVLHFAMAGLFIKTRSWRHAVLAGIAFACVLLMRPAGLSLFIGLPFLCWLLRGEVRKLLLGFALPAVLTLALVPLFNFIALGTSKSQSLGGLSLVGHVTYLLDENDAEGPFAEVIKDIVNRTSHITRPLRDAEFPYDQWDKTMNKYNEVLYGYTVPAITEFFNRKKTDPSKKISLKEISEIGIGISIIAIKNHPRSYIEHIFANYYGAWQGFLLDYGSVNAHANMCYGVMRKMHPQAYSTFARMADISYLRDPVVADGFAQRESERSLLHDVWREIVLARDGLRGTAFGLSIALILIAVLRLGDPLVILLSYASLQLNAYLGFISSVSATIERYSVPFTPILQLILVGTLIACARWGIRRYRRIG